MTPDEALLRDITEAARRSFDACREVAGAAEIIGYAICSDDSAITCSPVAASEQGLAAYAHGETDDFRFNPEEWNLQEEVDQLYALSDTLNTLHDESEDHENNEDWHDQYRTRVYELIVRALEQLDTEGYFGSGDERAGTFVMAWVCDSEVPQKRGPEWSQRLNRPALHGEFVKWLSETDYWG